MDLIRTSKVDNVRLLGPSKKSKPVVGTLHLTTTHLIFIDPQGAKETWILHSHIAAIERLPLTAAGSPLRVKTKTFNIVTFVISRERDCLNVYSTLDELSSPSSLEDLYAFHYSPKEDKLLQSAGWQLYDVTTEFHRMGTPPEFWVESKLNKDYKLSPTYPPVVLIPASAQESVVVGSAQFRSKGRFPALSYYHKSTKAAICRSAQPLAGLNTRSAEDEMMLQAIVRSNPASSVMYIIDTRPKINAMANRAAGKGYENVENYDNVKFQFIGIENIHVMRQSLQKMLEACDSNEKSISTFLGILESSAWLKHVKAVLDTSVFISKAVDIEKCSVLVHCSDGWDRTAQTCSLASIMLDPYYRTIHGFQVLIEKEWLHFGHKFIDRCGFLKGDSKETSPIFTQFLDCVWQFTQQFPTAFQFNQRFLITIHNHVYSCQFGTFLGNCCREREELSLSERTFSLWGFMWQHISEYVNPFYNEEDYSILIPSTSPQHIRFWRGLYARFDNDIHPRESITDHICAIDDQNKSLEDHIRLLEKKVRKMKNFLEKRNENSEESLRPNEESDNPSTSCYIDQKKEPLSEPPSLLLNERFLLDKKSEEDELLSNILEQMPSFSVEWKSLRGVTQCSCGSPIDYLTRKFNCWNCGEVFCSHCIDRQSSLPAHYSENKVPVCKSCFKLLRR
ncbi:myotubularin-related protein 6-like [Rhopilema esculentum]|uniref:myotubularin-related protein 6-like n=1 Tax=Rhopilema esculentum TaxID=499914 RepID=UPI0031E1207C